MLKKRWSRRVIGSVLLIGAWFIITGTHDVFGGVGIVLIGLALWLILPDPKRLTDD